MTGITVVTSDKSLDSVKNIFIWGPFSGTQNQAKKMAWVNLCVCKAAIKIINGDKKRKADIHQEMVERFLRWAKLIAEGDIGIDNTPGYVTETMLMTKDAKNQKPIIERTLTGGKKLWDKWDKIKREITGSDNIAIKSTIASMPCGALP